jgi:hypothetical protein
MITALFVASGGCYFGLPDVDPWDEQRDARLYAGPWPVVAHPPCARWCMLAGLVQHRYGHRIGDDGGCFASALESVRRWGGVLEHPAGSLAWRAYDLLEPRRGCWTRGINGDWVTEVCQSAYGHQARKRTWLLARSFELPALNWSDPEPSAWVSYGDFDRYPDVQRLSKKAASATPPAFRDLLLSIARSARAKGVA